MKAVELDFYFDKLMVRDAISRHTSFNLIHLETAFKIDIFLPKNRPFDQRQLARRVKHVIEKESSRTVFFAEVIATMVTPGICDDKGRLLVQNVNFFGMTPGSGEFYTMGDKVGHIGKTVKRSDIKY